MANASETNGQDETRRGADQNDASSSDEVRLLHRLEKLRASGRRDFRLKLGIRLNYLTIATREIMFQDLPAFHKICDRALASPTITATLKRKIELLGKRHGIFSITFRDWLPGLRPGLLNVPGNPTNTAPKFGLDEQTRVEEIMRELPLIVPEMLISMTRGYAWIGTECWTHNEMYHKCGAISGYDRAGYDRCGQVVPFGNSFCLEHNPKIINLLKEWERLLVSVQTKLMETSQELYTACSENRSLGQDGNSANNSNSTTRSGFSSDDDEEEEESQDSTEEDCAICLMPSRATTGPKLSCGHRFHFQCLRTWVSMQLDKHRWPGCPLCRTYCPFLHLPGDRHESVVSIYGFVYRPATTSSISSLLFPNTRYTPVPSLAPGIPYRHTTWGLHTIPTTRALRTSAFGTGTENPFARFPTQR